MKPLIVVLSFSIAALGFVQGPVDNSRAVSRNEPQESSTVPFKDFDAQIEIENAEFEVRGSFTLGETSNGINLFKEDVTFELGTFSKTIPAGAFKQDEKRGKVRYTESEKESSLDILFRLTGNNKFSVKIEGEGVKLPKQVRPEDITLQIGDDKGRARERVK